MGAVFFMVLAVITSPSIPSEGEWPAWRGQEREGRSDSSEGPLHWSPDENVRWKTAIPGSGCSSPVISRGQLYITTSYETCFFNNLQRALRVLSLLLLAGIEFIGIQCVTEQCCSWSSAGRRIWSLFSLSSILASFILLVVLVVWGSQWLDYGRCPIRGWLGTSIIVTLCLVLGRFNSRSEIRSSVFWSILALLLAVGIYVGIPSKDHVFREGLIGPPSCVVAVLAFLPAYAGIGWLRLSFKQWQNLQCKRVLLRDETLKQQYRASLAFSANDASPPRSATSSPWQQKQRKRGFILGGFGLLGMMCAGNILMVMFTSTAREYNPQYAPTLIDRCFWSFSAGLGGLCFTAVAFCPSHAIEPVTCTARKFLRISFLKVVFFAFLLLSGGYLLLRELVLRSEFMHYHLEKFLGIPWKETNWEIFLLTFGAGFLLLFLLQGHFPAVFLRWRKLANQCMLLILAGLVFFDNSVLRHTRQLVRAIVCLNAESGETLWHDVGLPGTEGSLHRLNTAATPTPVVEGDRVIAYFGSVGLLCCNTQGQHLWTNKSITFQSIYGAGVSLVAADGIVVLVNAMPKTPRLYAFIAESGIILWSVPLDPSHMNISGCVRTPLIKRLRGEQVILVWGPEWLEGYALNSGEKLWHYPLVSGISDGVASLVSDSQRLYCVGSKAAFALAWEDLGGSTSPVVWEVAVRGPNCASPLVTQGLLFFISNAGTVSCLEAETGHLLWQQLLPGEYYASPVVMGNHLYFTNLDGHTTVLQVAREFHKLGENDLSIEIMASPAPVARRLYFRGEEAIFCIHELRTLSERPHPFPLGTR